MVDLARFRFEENLGSATRARVVAHGQRRGDLRRAGCGRQGHKHDEHDQKGPLPGTAPRPDTGDRSVELRSAVKLKARTHIRRSGGERTVPAAHGRWRSFVGPDNTLHHERATLELKCDVWFVNEHELTRARAIAKAPPLPRPAAPSSARKPCRAKSGSRTSLRGRLDPDRPEHASSAGRYPQLLCFDRGGLLVDEKQQSKGFGDSPRHGCRFEAGALSASHPTREVAEVQSPAVQRGPA